MQVSRKTELTIRGAFGVALALLVVIGFASYYSVLQLSENSSKLAHSNEIMSAIDEMVHDATRAESAHRGFVITGDEQLLRDFDDIRSVNRQRRARLRVLAQGDAAQLAHLQELESAIDARFAYSLEIIGLRRTGGIEAVQENVRRLGLRGAALQARVHQLAEAMKADERAVLATRERLTARDTAFTRAVIIGGSTFALLFVALALVANRRDFSGRNRAEADLNRFFDLSTDLFAIAGADGYFKRLSPAIADMLGYSVDEALQIPYMDLLHPDDQPRARAAVSRQLGGGGRIDAFVGRMRHKDGSWRTLSWRSMARGNLMFASARDVTAETRATEEMRDAKEQLETRVADRTRDLEQANESLRRSVAERLAHERRLGEQLQRMSLLSRITRAIGERQDLGSIFQVLVRTIEEELPVELCCLCLYDAGENRLSVSAVGAKHAPEAQSIALRPDAALNIDDSGLGRCMRGELVYEPDIGSSAFELAARLASIGMRSLVIAPILVESQVFGALICARREAGAFSSGECEFLRQVSEHTALASHQAQLYTALQRAYDDLRQTQQQVMQQERLRALGQMASGIAHDINNAISPMALYTESLLTHEHALSERGRKQLEIIQRAVDDVAQTVARMGEFYRTREPESALAPVDLNLLAEHVVDLTRVSWSDMAHQRGAAIELVLQQDPALPPIAGVQSQIRDALVNLVFNAVDAMPQGGTLTIRTQVARDNHRRTVHVEVADTGIGMDEDTRRRCLEPFFSTKGARGTGLGLAMVYGVAQRHGGSLEIDSEPGKGTTVRLTFAAAAPRPAASAEAPSAPGNLRILIVDDDPLLLKSLSDALESDGHEVVSANGGQAGINAFVESHAEGRPFPVVITDLGMPHVDGRKVAATIKTSVPETVVLLLTGWGRRLNAEGEIPPGVDEILSKPPRLAEVRAALARTT